MSYFHQLMHFKTADNFTACLNHCLLNQFSIAGHSICSKHPLSPNPLLSTYSAAVNSFVTIFEYELSFIFKSKDSQQLDRSITICTVIIPRCVSLAQSLLLRTYICKILPNISTSPQTQCVPNRMHQCHSANTLSPKFFILGNSMVISPIARVREPWTLPQARGRLLLLSELLSIFV